MLGERIKSLRGEKHITQQQLADYLAVGKSTIGMWENEKREPDIETLVKIAEYFCVSIDYLAGKTDQKLDDKTWDKYAAKFESAFNARLENDIVLVEQLFSDLPQLDQQIVCESIVPAIRTIDHTALIKLKDYADDLARLETYRIEKAIEEDQRQKEKSAD